MNANRAALRLLVLPVIALLVILVATSSTPSGTAEAQEGGCSVAGVDVDCDSEQVVNAHVPYCAYTHWHGPLDGAPDPNQGGCGHGPVVQDGEPYIAEGLGPIDLMLAFGFSTEEALVALGLVDEVDAQSFRFASDPSGPPTITPPFGEVVGMGAGLITFSPDFPFGNAPPCDNEPGTNLGAPGDDRLLVLCDGGSGIMSGGQYVGLFGQLGGDLPPADPLTQNFSFQTSFPGGEQWMPLPQYPGDIWQGGGLFPTLTQEGGTGFFTFQTSVVEPGNTLAYVPTESVLLAGGNSIIVFVPVEQFPGLTEDNLGDFGFGFGSHVHDGRFGMCADCPSLVSVFPSVPRDGLVTAPGGDWPVLITGQLPEPTATPASSGGSSASTGSTPASGGQSTTSGGSAATTTDGGGNGLTYALAGGLIVIAVGGGGYYYWRQQHPATVLTNGGPTIVTGGLTLTSDGSSTTTTERPQEHTHLGRVERDEDLLTSVQAFISQQDEKAADEAVTNREEADWQTITFREQAVQERLQGEFARVMGADGQPVSIAGATAMYAAAMDRFKTAFLQITSRSTTLQGLMTEWEGARETAKTADMIWAVAQIGVGLGKVGVSVGPRLWRWWKAPRNAAETAIRGTEHTAAMAQAWQQAGEQAFARLAAEAGVDAGTWVARHGGDIEAASIALTRKLAADRGWVELPETVEAVLGRLLSTAGRNADPADIAQVLRWQQHPSFWDKVGRGAAWFEEGAELGLRFSGDHVAFLRRFVNEPGSVASAANVLGDATSTVRLGANEATTIANRVGLSADDIPTVLLKPGAADNAPTILLGGADNAPTTLLGGADNTPTVLLLGDNAPTVLLGGPPGGAPTVLFGGPGGSLLPPTTFFPPPAGALDDTVRVADQLADTVRGAGVSDDTVLLADQLADTVKGINQGPGAYTPTIQWPAPGALDDTVRLADQLADTVRGAGLGDDTVRLADQFADTVTGMGSGTGGYAPTIHWPAPQVLDDTVLLADQLADTVRGLGVKDGTVRLADQLADTVRGMGSGTGAYAPTIHWPAPQVLDDTVRLADQLADTVRNLGGTDDTVRLADQLADTVRGMGPGTGAYAPTLKLPPAPTGTPTAFWPAPTGLDDTVLLADQFAGTARTAGRGDETVRLADQLAETVRGIGPGLDAGAPTVWWRPQGPAYDQTVRLADQMAQTLRLGDVGAETVRTADQLADTVRGLGQGVDCGAPTILWPAPSPWDATVRLGDDLCGALRTGGATDETVRLADQCSETLRLTDPSLATLRWPLPPVDDAATQATALVDALRASGADAETVRLAQQVADNLSGVRFATGTPRPAPLFPLAGGPQPMDWFSFTTDVAVPVTGLSTSSHVEAGLDLDFFIAGQPGDVAHRRADTFFAMVGEREGWHLIDPAQGLILEDTIMAGRLAAAGYLREFPPQVGIVQHWAQQPVFYDWVATAQVPIDDGTVRMFTAGDIQLLQATVQANGDPSKVGEAVGPIQQISSQTVTRIGMGQSEQRLRFGAESAQIFDSASMPLTGYLEQFGIVGKSVTEDGINWIEVGLSDEELFWGIPGLKLKGFVGDVLFSPIETSAGLWYSHKALDALNEFYHQDLGGGMTGYDLLSELSSASHAAVTALEQMGLAIQQAQLDRPGSTLGGAAADELRDILGDYNDLFEGMSPEGQAQYQDALVERYWHITQKLSDLMDAIEGLKDLGAKLAQLTPWLESLLKNTDGSMRTITDYYNPLLFVRMGAVALALQELAAGTVPGAKPPSSDPRTPEEIQEASERNQAYMEQMAAEFDSIDYDAEANIDIDFSDIDFGDQ